MKHILSETDRDLLDRKIADTEKLTRAQIVLAAVRRSDSYAEIPWKAFAIGSALAGLVVFLIDLLVLGWITGAIIILSAAGVLATGALFATLTVLAPGFARLFLTESRSETETMQYAESLFLSHELFGTQGRRGILLLVSQFERQVVILPDKGVRELLSTDIMKDIIMKMTPLLRKKMLKGALETGLGELGKILGPTVVTRPDKDELENEIIVEEGE